MFATMIGILAYSTFRETVRDRIFYLVAVFGFVMLASTAVVSPSDHRGPGQDHDRRWAWPP